MTTQWARRALFRTLEGLADAHLTLVTEGKSYRFGDACSDLQAVIEVHNPAFFTKAVFGGDDGAGDSFVDGDWSSPDLVAVIRLAVRNLRRLEQGSKISSWFSRALSRLSHLRRANTLEGSRRNIAAHYDLSNDFFRLFLDENMLYSSSVFPSHGASLEEAQVEKMDRLCRKLSLCPEDRLLEIGTGWGSFALHAASNYGCQVTTTTISREQYAHAASRFQGHGRIRLLQQDYRELTGEFDKIVSIEMFEAVGLANYDAFFSVCDRLLVPGGTLAMQTITMNDQRFNDYCKRGDWIQRRIFPGGELASLLEIQKSLTRCTALGPVHMEDIGMHYAYTLAEWTVRFDAARDRVRSMGFDDAFIRTWGYYLAYCEGAFRERYISAAQLVFAKAGGQSVLFGEPWQSAQRVGATA